MASDIVPAGIAPADIVAADKKAMAALARVDESASSQIAALAALEDLHTACAQAAGAKESILAHEVQRLIRERKDAFRAAHRDRVARAVRKHELQGSTARNEAESAIENAIEIFSVIDRDGGELRTLRERLVEVKRDRPGKPRPFFARYLEHQKR